jgi:deoxyribose-phosphate aldolase
MSVTAKDIAAMIDHSLLRPELTVEEVRAGCRLAAEYGVVSVCVRPCDVPVAREILAGTAVRVTTVIGFPHGAHTSAVKVFEAQQAIAAGAVELDMVLNIGRLRSGDHDYVERDIRVVVETAHEHGVLVKVIFENCYLSDEQKKTACRLAERAGADFVKTSTGFAPGGATLDDLRLMRASVGPRVQVKAAGGVRTLGAAMAVRRVGATRFGATATREIMNDARAREAAGTLESAIGEIGDSY